MEDYEKVHLAGLKRFERLETLGLVRFRVEPDECVELEDMFGDTYTPELHPEIPEEQILKEKQEYIDRINRDGVWGIISEYRINPRLEFRDTSITRHSEDSHYMGENIDGEFMFLVGDGWAHGGSCWGFVGEDYENSGTDSDVKGEAIDALRVSIRNRCRQCMRTGHKHG